MKTNRRQISVMTCDGLTHSHESTTACVWRWGVCVCGWGSSVAHGEAAPGRGGLRWCLLGQMSNLRAKGGYQTSHGGLLNVPGSLSGGAALLWSSRSGWEANASKGHGRDDQPRMVTANGTRVGHVVRNAGREPPKSRDIAPAAGGYEASQVASTGVHILPSRRLKSNRQRLEGTQRRLEGKRRRLQGNRRW